MLTCKCIRKSLVLFANHTWLILNWIFIQRSLKLKYNQNIRKMAAILDLAAILNLTAILDYWFLVLYKAIAVICKSYLADIKVDFHFKVKFKGPESYNTITILGKWRPFWIWWPYWIIVCWAKYSKKTLVLLASYTWLILKWIFNSKWWVEVLIVKI